MVLKGLNKAILAVDKDLQTRELECRQQRNEAAISVRWGREARLIRGQLVIANIRLAASRVMYGAERG